MRVTSFPTSGSMSDHDNASGRKHQSAQQRRVSQQGLKKDGKQRGAAVKHETQHEHGQRGKKEVAVLEQAKIHNGIFAREFPESAPQSPTAATTAHHDDEVGPKPVLALALVQNHLQESQADAE